jgi:hypothetical protein
MHETHGERFDALPLQGRHGRAQLRFVQWGHDAAAEIHTLVDLDTSIARGRRYRLRDIEIEVMRPTLPREFEYVSKPRRRQHPGAGRLALEDRVGRERRAQHHELDLAALGPGQFDDFRDALENRPGRIVGRRGKLVVPVFAGCDIGQHDIGKRTARVDADPETVHATRLKKAEGFSRE